MSNPLIKPSDSRFQPPPLRDAAGNNLFVDPDAQVAAQAADGQAITPAAAVTATDSNLFATPAATADEPAYQPRYETNLKHRGILLLILAIVGLAGDGALLMTVLAGPFGLIGLAAIIPAAAAWIVGQGDLRAMRQGAMDDSGRTMTRVAMWLGLAGGALYFVVLLILVAVAVLLLPFMQNA